MDGILQFTQVMTWVFRGLCVGFILVSGGGFLFVFLIRRKDKKPRFVKLLWGLLLVAVCFVVANLTVSITGDNGE